VRPTLMALLGILLLQAPISQADNPRFGDNFSLSLGVLNSRADASIGSTLGQNAAVDLTLRDLDMDARDPVFWADLAWQFDPRWRWGLTYSSFSSSGLVNARSAGNFGSIEFEAEAELRSSLDTDLLVTEVIYDIVQTERLRIGAGAGLHLARLDFSLLARLAVQAGDGDAQQILPPESAKVDVLAPLPNFSLSAGYRVSEQLYAGFDVGYLSLRSGKYDGRIFSWRAKTEWRPRKNLGLGLAYQFIDLDLDVSKTLREDRYDIEFSGPAVFLSYGF